MKREDEILKAARDYVNGVTLSVNGVTLSSPSNGIHFEYGAKWADEHPNLESLWHDASEEPQYKNKCILIYSEYFNYSFTDFPNYLMIKEGGQNKDWGVVVLINKISKWAYIDDLLPKQFRKSEQLKEDKK